MLRGIGSKDSLQSPTWPLIDPQRNMPWLTDVIAVITRSKKSENGVNDLSSTGFDG
jgi:hypothetical protein